MKRQARIEADLAILFGALKDAATVLVRIQSGHTHRRCAKHSPTPKGRGICSCDKEHANDGVKAIDAALNHND